MASDPPASAGFIDSLRALGDGLVAGALERLELFAVELHEEKLRLIQTFIWICAAAFAGMMAIAFASLTLVYVCPESARSSVLAGLTVFYVAVCATIILLLRRFLLRQPRPFAATRQEIGVDRACIRNRN
ncbi:MAG: phage holin family protein [Opitutae bacterium]|nr:phage holin family protein [Opitutae bacterium]